MGLRLNIEEQRFKGTKKEVGWLVSIPFVHYTLILRNGIRPSTADIHEAHPAIHSCLIQPELEGLSGLHPTTNKPKPMKLIKENNQGLRRVKGSNTELVGVFFKLQETHLPHRQEQKDVAVSIRN